MDPFRMLRPVGIAPNPNAGLRPVGPRPNAFHHLVPTISVGPRPPNEQKDNDSLNQQSRLPMPNNSMRDEEEKQGMKRGGKVKRKPKKAVKKTRGISQVQTVKVNINTGRREKRKKAEKPATQPAFNMFGYRLAPSMPIMGATPGLSSQQDSTKLDLVLSKIAEQREEAEKQQKTMEDIQSTRQPTGQPAVSSVFGPASAPIELTRGDIIKDINIASAAPQPTPSPKFNIPIRKQVPGSTETFTSWSAGYPNPKMIVEPKPSKKSKPKQ